MAQTVAWRRNVRVVDAASMLEADIDPLQRSIRYLLESLRSPDEMNEIWAEHMGGEKPPVDPPAIVLLDLAFRAYDERVQAGLRQILEQAEAGLRPDDLLNGEPAAQGGVR